MNSGLVIAVVVIAGMYSSISIGQPNKYYLDRYGVIQNVETYAELREEALNSIEVTGEESSHLFENINELHNGSDSIILSYNWVVTDDLAGTEKEFQQRNSLIGQHFPIIDEGTLDGRNVNIEDYKGKPTLVNLWFTTCPPCVREMPVLNRMKEQNRDKYNFLAITMDSRSRVIKFLKKQDFDFEHIVNSNKLTTKLGVGHYPVNLFLDKEGMVRAIEDSVPLKEDSSGSPNLNPGKFLWILEYLL